MQHWSKKQTEHSSSKEKTRKQPKWSRFGKPSRRSPLSPLHVHRQPTQQRGVSLPLTGGLQIMTGESGGNGQHYRQRDIKQEWSINESSYRFPFAPRHACDSKRCTCINEEREASIASRHRKGGREGVLADIHCRDQSDHACKVRGSVTPIPIGPQSAGCTPPPTFY